jgi:hypothetical protein
MLGCFDWLVFTAINIGNEKTAKLLGAAATTVNILTTFIG